MGGDIQFCSTKHPDIELREFNLDLKMCAFCYEQQGLDCERSILTFATCCTCPVLISQV